MSYPRRLIEVDLPIARISGHARREKSQGRRGHVSTLHIWWARRPLAACRAVLCAALWPDPVDPECPAAFRRAAVSELTKFASAAWASMDVLSCCAEESRPRWRALAEGSRPLNAQDRLHWPEVRASLLDFIGDFASVEAAGLGAFEDVARAISLAAHEALAPGESPRPVVLDPFAGGGSIPVEALRLGAETFASDLNPVATLLNRVLVEVIPRHGEKIDAALAKWGAWVQAEAERLLGSFYAVGKGAHTPISYLWARTISCEGPGCGATVPLIKSTALARRGARSVSLKLVPEPTSRRVLVEIVADARSGSGTIQRGSVTCPFCRFTTPVARVRVQLAARAGGASDAQLLCVVEREPGGRGKRYRTAQDADVAAYASAAKALAGILGDKARSTLVPDEPTPPDGTGSKGGGYRTRKYGVLRYRDFFNDRQLVQHVTLTECVREAQEGAANELGRELGQAVGTLLAVAASRQVDRDSAFCRWRCQTEAVAYTFGRQAIPMTWDFVESPALRSSGGWTAALDDIRAVVSTLTMAHDVHGAVHRASALSLPLPDDAVDCLLTDPPYFDAVPYAELGDFFFVWLRRALPFLAEGLADPTRCPRTDECVVNLNEGKDQAYFRDTMTKALAEARRVVKPSGIGVIVFAHKSTRGWEAMLEAVLDSGWSILASWPIDTERPGRLRAQDSAALASSVHLVCRPREAPDGSLIRDEVGDWRDVREELPRRVHEWLPRLAEEGVVGADAIFACLGPAIEVFSRYSRVERANEAAVTLREYLEHVWAAISNEALWMIFRDADAGGLEPDGRLTAMWLWTLGASSSKANPSATDSNSTEDEEEPVEDAPKPKGKAKAKAKVGFTLEFDAARKIAQGLGVELDKLSTLVEVEGETARLLPVTERARTLFSARQDEQSEAVVGGGRRGRGRKKTPKQTELFEGIDVVTRATDGIGGSLPARGASVLDRLHQAMLLFAANRGEALRKYLVDEAVGQDVRFWKLAQSLTALYPPGTEEKRWVDGVLGRKKGLGF